MSIEIKNFKLLNYIVDTIGGSIRYDAEVTLMYPIKEEVRKIHSLDGKPWFYVETGELCGPRVDYLVRMLEAEHNKGLREMVLLDAAIKILR